MENALNFFHFLSLPKAHFFSFSTILNFESKNDQIFDTLKDTTPPPLPWGVPSITLTEKSEMPLKQKLLLSRWEMHLTKPGQNPARPLTLRSAAARGALTFFRLTRNDNGIA